MPEIAAPSPAPVHRWLTTGAAAVQSLCEAMDGARESIRLEIYILEADAVGERIRDRLVAAAKRGVEVRVLVDAFGSITLSDEFWEPLRAIGGAFRWFNRMNLERAMFRNHRKLVIVDGEVGFIGGFNLAEAWSGDGVLSGWHDLGMEVRGPAVALMTASFEEMFGLADFQPRRFVRLLRPKLDRRRRFPGGELLLTGPMRGPNPFKRALTRDLAHAGSVHIVAAYFLPTWGIRRLLARRARRGTSVRILLPGRSDIPLMRLAARTLYARLMRAGVQIYEYRPQILHSKLVVVDNATYVGSANLDIRSLQINYELVVRWDDPGIATEGRELFNRFLEHANRIDPSSWGRSRGLLTRWSEQWAYILLARIDPFVAGWQRRSLH